MQKTTSQVLKEMAPWIIITLIITGAINGLFNVLGITVGTGIGDMITQIMGGVPINPEPQNSGLTVLQNIGGFFVVGLTSLISAALGLGVYRNLRYDTKMQFEDLFYFFNRHFLFNLLSSVLISLITTVGYLLLVIPGVIASLGFLPWGIWLAKHQTDEKISPKEVVKDTWQSTKGKKGMILGNYILYALLVIAIFVVAGILVAMTLAGADAGSGPGAGSIVLIGLIMIPLTLVMSIVAYVPYINSVRSLAEDGVFDEAEEVAIEYDGTL